MNEKCQEQDSLRFFRKFFKKLNDKLNWAAIIQVDIRSSLSVGCSQLR